MLTLLIKYIWNGFLPLRSLVAILRIFLFISLTLAHGPANLIMQDITLDLSVALGLETFASLCELLLKTAYGMEMISLINR